MKNNTIIWPTERHKQLVGFIVDLCKKEGIGVILKGSIAKGKAKAFSDIDLSLDGKISVELLKNIIYGFEHPLIINSSENPPGLLIIAYKKALALDLGVNNVGSSIKKDKSLILVKSKCNGSPECTNYLEEYMKKISGKSNHMKIQKLFHKGLLKFLNGNLKESTGFIEEILEVAHIKRPISPNIPDIFKYLLKKISVTDKDIRKEFEWLVTESFRM